MCVEDILDPKVGIREEMGGEFEVEFEVVRDF
jgi:hypothetical protein